MQNFESRAIEIKESHPHEADLFNRCVRQYLGMDMRGRNIKTIQVNIGLRCNLVCRHCHVKSSPRRTEEMDWGTMKLVLNAAEKAGAETLDITGGAPEMNPCFRRFISTALARNLNVTVRTNLTIMNSHGYDDLPEYFAENRVHLVASLPCYIESNVDKQRGKHVYLDCIHVLRKLNALGYGMDSVLKMDLVYNPSGPFLPPAQSELENIYRIEMARKDIHFTNLYAIANMPIGRFHDDLRRDGKMEQYMQMLRDAFNPTTLESLMCRRQIHIGWDGTVYDCDFNFAKGLPVANPNNIVRDFDPAQLLHRRIAIGEHCFGCTAGYGSSCGGALESVILNEHTASAP